MSTTNGKGKAEVNGEGTPPCVPRKASLYQRLRPRRLKDVVGQPEAVSALGGFLKAGNFPSALMLTGNSGTGKTTLVRIIAARLGCHELDYLEVNCAGEKAPDVIRGIPPKVSVRPVGSVRIFYLDEFQALSRAPFAQQALLKVMEDTPEETRFVIATTDPSKIIDAIKTRCVTVRLSPLREEHLGELLTRAAASEGRAVGAKLRAAITEAACGSGRTALNLLEQAWALGDEEEAQLAAVRCPAAQQKAFDMVKALLYSSTPWDAVVKVLNGLEGEDPEGLRRMILACARKELLKGGRLAGRAHALINCFRDPYFNNDGLALLAADAYSVTLKK
jgi:DNA polymerase III gamma/tau subunit